MRMDDPSSDGDACGSTLCSPTPPGSTLGTLVALTPFLATFAVVAGIAARRIFPALSRSQFSSNHDGEDHFLPASAPAALRRAHADHGARSSARRGAAATAFATTLGLAAVLAELILVEVAGYAGSAGPRAALAFTVPTLLVMLVGAIPFLEIQGLVAGAGWSFRRTKSGGLPRVAWTLQLIAFGVWLCVFWWLGGVVPVVVDESDYLRGRHYGDDGRGEGQFDSTGLTIGRASARGDTVREVLGRGGLARACLERIGVIGILLMALLSGFASVSSPWHTFVDNRSYRRRPVTDADIARKQAGLDATAELLHSKRHRLGVLQRKLATQADADAATSGSAGLVGKMIGSLKSIGGSGGDAGEVRSLQLEISGLETMEASLASALSVIRSKKAAHARDGTTLGALMALPNYAFGIYCIYRILATILTTFRRRYQPAAAFSTSDPVSRFLGLLARHWDPKLDQIAWSRQISFLLSGVILAASANSVLQTFHLFAKWAPGLLYQAQANLALAIGQVAATYVISSALLLRSNLPRDVGQSVGDALASALEPGFVDRWFEGWFLAASAATAAGIWVGGKIAGVGPLGEWDDWDDYGGEEMGQKRS